MDQVYHVKLGESRRIALPAELCRKFDLKPGEPLLLTPGENGVTVTSLRNQAGRMCQELQEMLGKSKPLTEDLKQLRKAEAAREAGPR